MNKKLGLLFLPLMIFSLVPSSFAQVNSTDNILSSVDLEDLALAEPTRIDPIDEQVCGQTQLTDVTLPFTMTVKYPQTLAVEVVVSSNSPEKSEMKAIRDKDFFTLSTNNSTDVFTVSSHWNYDSKPNYPRFISYEIYSDNQRVQQEAIPFDSFEYCHLFTIETELKVHVPTIDEFLAENDVRINNAFEVVAQLQLDNNDLVLILIAVIVALFSIVILLVGVLIWFNRDVSKKAEEAENRYDDTTEHLDEIIAGVKVLARNDYSKNSTLRDAFLKSVSLGNITISNLVIDLRNILHEVIGKKPDEIHLESVNLKSEATKPTKEIKKLVEQKPKEEKPFFWFLKKNKKKQKEKEDDKISFETFFKKYDDAKKYPSTKLSLMDEKLRVQYKKSPTPKLINEINAIAKIIEKRMGIK